MRAIEPATTGYAERDGVKLYWEQFGEGEPTIALLPTWSIAHSRHWKFQVPYLARHFRVVTFDGRGNGHSGRPADPSAYTDVQFASDTLAVLDATDTQRAVLLSVSRGAWWALRVCAEHPDRVQGTVFVGPGVRLTAPLEERRIQRFNDVIDQPVGWQKHNAHYWKTNYPDYVSHFIPHVLCEPHSTKPIEDAVGWALETDGETLVATERGLLDRDAASAVALASKVRCPALVIHGVDDAICSVDNGVALATRIAGPLVTLVGAGHWPHVRDPVRVNLLVKEFVDRVGR